MSRLIRSLLLAVLSISAVTVSSSALADRGRWKYDDDDRHERWERRYDDDRHDRWEHRRHRHEWKHRHDHVYRERVVVVREPSRIYLPPPPVVYRDVRPVVSISVPDIIIPF